MTQLAPHLTAEKWLLQIFTSTEAAKGGVVKRQTRDIERLVGMDLFLSEVERRGFQAIENRNHVVIFCNREPIRRLRRD